MNLEQVKEHFKNAKEVRCLCDGIIYKIDKKNNVYFFSNNIWTEDEHQGTCVLLYRKLTEELAEIVSYKDNLKEIEVEAEEIKSNSELEAFFDDIINDTLSQIRETLIVKGKEYRRNNNPFHNFDVGAIKKQTIREKVLDGMLLKHEISIDDMTNDIEKGILPSISTVNEKFNDNIIYLMLKKASILDRVINNKNN